MKALYKANNFDSSASLKKTQCEIAQIQEENKKEFYASMKAQNSFPWAKLVGNLHLSGQTARCFEHEHP